MPPSATAGRATSACSTADKPQTPTQEAPRSYSDLFVQLGLESPLGSDGVQARLAGSTEPAADAAAAATGAAAPRIHPQNAEAALLSEAHAAAAPSQVRSPAVSRCGGGYQHVFPYRLCV